MNRYTIYCTEEQTEKALELGAPIEINSHPPLNGEKFMWLSPPADAIAWNNSTNCLVPTAEQMIGWLEEQGIHIKIDCEGSLNYVVQLQFINSPKDLDVINRSYKGIIGHRGFPSCEEATLAAIDAALDYLISNKRMNQLITDN